VYSRDGSRVAFVTNRSGAQELWVSRANGTDSQLLVSVKGEVGFADWSPDSRRIAFTAQRDSFKHLFTVSSSGGTPKQSTAGSSNNGEPSWSHDGKWLYFSSDRDGKNQIWKTPADPHAGSEPVRITNQGGDRSLASPDGKYLFYVIGGERSRLFRLALDGGTEAELLVGPISNAGNFWVSKSGVYFVAPENANGKASICFLPFSSSRPRTIAMTEKPPFWGLSVSPDERSLLFAQLDRSEYDLMLIEDFR
jgi:dipeptidyl aminopeptidase/acylaminoacyl peptidase